jgi:hypothetical protein
VGGVATSPASSDALTWNRSGNSKELPRQQACMRAMEQQTEHERQGTAPARVQRKENGGEFGATASSAGSGGRWREAWLSGQERLALSHEVECCTENPARQLGVGGAAARLRTCT